MSTTHLPRANHGIGKARLEALSDGIFAVSMTLLIYQIPIPMPGKDIVADLGQQLVDLLPKFEAYAVSFLIVGVYWVGHQSLLNYVRYSNRVFIWLNLLFLLFISATPFSTTLLGSHPNESLAVLVYCVNMILAGMGLYGLLSYAAGPGQLIEPDTDPRFIQLAKQRLLMGPALYAVALAVGFLSTFVALLICVFTATLHILPGRVDRYWRQPGRTPSQPD